LQDPEVLKKLLMAQVRAGGGSQALDAKAVVQNLVKQTFEALLEVERDRSGDFEPKIVGKRQTSVGNFTEIVIWLCARSMKAREIEEHVKQLYGIDISAQFVSRATEQLDQHITDWQSRPLERIYPVVFVDGLRVAVRTEKGILKKCVYAVLGVGGPGSARVVDRGDRRRPLPAQGFQRPQGVPRAGHPGSVLGWAE
jgi:transposase-like protein